MTFWRRLFRDRAEEERLQGELCRLEAQAERREVMIETLRELLAERRPAPARSLLAQRTPPQPGTVGISAQGPIPVRPRKTVDRDPGPMPGYDADQIERDDDASIQKVGSLNGD